MYQKLMKNVSRSLNAESHQSARIDKRGLYGKRERERDRERNREREREREGMEGKICLMKFFDLFDNIWL